MNKNLKRLLVATAVTTIGLSYSSTVYAADGWQKNESGQWTYYENEQQAKKKWIDDAAGHSFYIDNSGVMLFNKVAGIDGDYYLFDANGYMARNGWCTTSTTNATTGKVSYTWYYADADGKLYSDEWKLMGDAWFYFAKGGRAARNGVATVGDKKYYIHKDQGCLGIGGGWFSAEAERALPTDPVRLTWYYAETDGALYCDGWKTINGASFYFGKYGNATRNGVVTVEDKKYYIDQEKGCLGAGGGWFSVDTTDAKGNVTAHHYYANADSSLINNGWYVVDGVRQYFNGSGENYKNRWFTLDGQKLYVDETGAQQQPGWFSISGVSANGTEYTNWYYLDADYNLMSEGFHELDGHMYYFNAGGMNFRKAWYVDAEKNRYYLDENGYLQNQGWFSIDTTNTTTGVVTTTWYYANADGSCLLNGFHDIEGKTYYFNTAGGLFQNRWLVDAKKKKQFFNKDGHMERSSWFATESTTTITGPATVDLKEEEITTTKSNWYYADEEGYIIMNGARTIDGVDYKFNTAGILMTGWENIKGTSDYFYYKEDGSKAYGWQLITIPNPDGTTYDMYQKNYGDLAWFYFDKEKNGRNAHSASGFMERTIDGKLYCLNKRGMVQYGWVNFKSGTGMGSFHYFMPVETGTASSVSATGAVDGAALHSKAKDGYLPGERVTSQWVWSEAPLGAAGGDKSATWYYIKDNGLAERAEQDIVKLMDINGYHAFDEFGRTYSGFGFTTDKNTNINEIYYFDVDNYNTAVAGIKEIELNGRKETFCFKSTGEGVTGIQDGYLYYKGRRQTGSGTRGVSYNINENKDASSQIVTVLVDASGKVITNASNLEGSGAVWSSNDSGRVTDHSGNSEQATSVNRSDMSVCIGDFTD